MFKKDNLITFAILAILITGFALMAELSGVRLYQRIVINMLISMVLVLGLQSFMGNSGILSFAHIGFMGVGAYTSAILSIPERMKGMALPDLYPFLESIQMSPYLSIFVGGIMAALVAAALSYPLMRLSDAAAVITSFALLVVIYTVLNHWGALTNGPRTLFGIPKITNLFLAVLFSLIALVMALMFKESKTGKLLRASRDDETAATSMGVNVPLLRWYAFIFAALLAGIGGALWGHFISSFAPKSFYLKETFVILSMLVIGGPNTVTGAVAGTIVVTIAFESLRSLETKLNEATFISQQVIGLTEIVLALAMIAVLIFRPGVFSQNTKSANSFLIKLKGKFYELEKAYRSFYYENAEDPDDIILSKQKTALLVIDIQNTYLEDKDTKEETSRWQPFYERMHNTVIPNTQALLSFCRDKGIEVIHARIACLKEDGRDRSLSQKKPGFNYLLLPKDREDSQIVDELKPLDNEITIIKTTDSALTGTNLRLILHNMGVENVVVAGIFTDQCVSSTVRSLADESFNVVVIDDCCAAATDELHENELKIINMIYCHVVSLEEMKSFVA